jgi:hypothetical protein
MTTAMKKLYQRLSDAEARLDVVVCIAGMLGDGDALAEPLEDLLEEEPAVLRLCFPDLPDWVEQALDSRRDVAGTFAEWAVQEGRLGFAVKISTPVMRQSRPNSWSFSWGHYRTCWVYGETLEQAVQKGLEWVADRRKAEQAKV